ncbi:MAG: virulence factor [Exilibacterium sp.]
MQKITTYWRDIPSQVMFQKSRSQRGKAMLSERFQEAIDRAAMRSGSGGTDDYLADWRKEPETVEDVDADLTELAQQEVDRMEALYSDEDLKQLVLGFGRVQASEG